MKKNLSQHGQDIEVLKGVDLSVSAGESIAVMGVSGSGKTTLLHILAGIEGYDGGRVEIGGGRAGLVFQHHYLVPELNAIENVALAARISGTDKSESLRLAAQGLAAVGLEARADHLPAELSGGEMARVAIARALSTSPRVILADEPTGNLDEKTKEKIQQLLFDVATAHNAALVIVTHDPHLAALASACYHLEHGVLSKRAPF